MKNLAFRLLFFCIVILGCCPVFAGNNNVPSNPGVPNQTAVQYKVIWNNATSLIFDGNPNNIQTGDLGFTIFSDSKCKNYYVRIIGTAFSNGDSSLYTLYQSGCEEKWYGVGDSLLIPGVFGKENKVKFQASTKSRVSSQKAGLYTAKISIIELTLR